MNDKWPIGWDGYTPQEIADALAECKPCTLFGRPVVYVDSEQLPSTDDIVLGEYTRDGRIVFPHKPSGWMDG